MTNILLGRHSGFTKYPWVLCLWDWQTCSDNGCPAINVACVSGTRCLAEQILLPTY